MFTRKHSIFTLVLVCLFALSGSVKAQYDATLSVFDVGPSEQVRDTTVHSKSFGAKISHLFHNIKNLMWDVDSSYCEPRQYRGQIKLMDRIMYESLDMDADDGTGVAMHSHVANYVGPGVVFSPLGLSVKWDLSPHKYDDNGEDVDRQKMEMGINVYNQLLYADLFYRKTGGDFDISRYNAPGLGALLGKDTEEIDGMGLTRIDWIGGDVNLILNHRRFSMPAAYMGNGRQLRSVGSPIIGFGYSHRLIENSVADLTSVIAMLILASIDEDEEVSQEMYKQLEECLACKMPSRLVFNDYHASLGYSYNWVLSPHFLVNGTLTLQPAIKTAHLSNTDVLLETVLREDMQDMTKPQEQRQMSQNLYNDFVFDIRKTFLDFNAIARLSAMWSKNQWRVGANMIYNSSRFHVSPVKVNSTLFAANVYVQYSFFNRSRKLKLHKSH